MKFIAAKVRLSGIIWFLAFKAVVAQTQEIVTIEMSTAELLKYNLTGVIQTSVIPKCLLG